MKDEPKSAGKPMRIIIPEPLKRWDSSTGDPASSKPYYYDTGAALPNGIACPECGAELVDTEPDVTLLSAPPQKKVRCSQCAYSGLREDPLWDAERGEFKAEPDDRS